MSGTGRIRLTTACGIALILLVWQVSATLWFTQPSGKAGAIPPPLEVLERLGADLINPVYWTALSVTAAAALAGFVIGVVFAVVFGVLVMLFPLLESFAVQIGLLSACLPAAAIAPIIVLLSPPSSRLVEVVLAALAVVFPVIIGVLLGLRATSSTQVDLIRAYGGSEIMVIRQVRLVSALPAVLAALKIGVPSAFLGAIVGEFFAVGVDSGAGRVLISLEYVGDFVGMWAVAVLCTLVSALGYAAVGLIGHALAPWTGYHGARRSA